MDELRELLREQAESMRIPTTLPPGARRRARRHRIGAVAGAGLLTAVLVGGGVFASNLVTSERRIPLAGPSPTAAPTFLPPTAEPTPADSGEHLTGELQILNGTDTSGIAAETANDLEKDGYKIVAVGNARRVYKQTRLLYTDGSKALAEYMARRYFPEARVEPTGPNTVPRAHVYVILGLDRISGYPSSAGGYLPPIALEENPVVHVMWAGNGRDEDFSRVAPSVGKRLDRLGYRWIVEREPYDDSGRTKVLYRKGYRERAEQLARQMFPEALVRPVHPALNPTYLVVFVVGADYHD